MSFARFKKAVQLQFEGMQTFPLFQVDVTGKELWQCYIQSFPEGTSPVFRVREEHNCSACRQFIKTVGGLIATKQGILTTLWDVDPTGLDAEYIEVSQRLSQLVKSRPILNRFVHDQKVVGVDKNFEPLSAGACRAREHFSITIPQNYLLPRKDIATVRAQWSTAYELLMRALQTITQESVEIVLDLIAQNSLYRGQEFRHVVEQFQTFKENVDGFSETRARCIYVWEYVHSNGSNALVNIRNSVIGTLLVSLSEGMELEQAVAAFERKVAPF